MYMYKKYERRVIYLHFRFVTFTKFISAHFQTILKGKMRKWFSKKFLFLSLIS